MLGPIYGSTPFRGFVVFESDKIHYQTLFGGRKGNRKAVNVSLSGGIKMGV
jgi:hypothetical protein